MKRVSGQAINPVFNQILKRPRQDDAHCRQMPLIDVNDKDTDDESNDENANDDSTADDEAWQVNPTTIEQSTTSTSNL